MSGPTIYFLRHGQTDWNVEKRFQGQRDIPINETGREQARLMGDTLKQELGAPENCDFIASPLARTMETMQLVRLTMGLPVNGFATDGRLKEVSYGDWEGFTEVEIEANFPEMIEARRADKYRTQTPRGESYEMLLARVKSWLAYIERDSVVVTHGGVIRVLLHHFNGIDPNEAVAATVPQDRIFKWDGGQAKWL